MVTLKERHISKFFLEDTLGYGVQKLMAAHPVNYFPGFLGINIKNCPPSKLFLFTSLSIRDVKQSYLVRFLEILVSAYSLGPYAPGPLIIWKNIPSKYAPGPYLKCTLLHEHIANLMLLEHI